MRKYHHTEILRRPVSHFISRLVPYHYSSYRNLISRFTHIKLARCRIFLFSTCTSNYIYNSHIIHSIGQRASLSPTICIKVKIKRKYLTENLPVSSSIFLLIPEPNKCCQVCSIIKGMKNDGYICLKYFCVSFSIFLVTVKKCLQ